MKKLIAISVMLALVAGAVFAETQVSGEVETNLNLYDNNGKDGHKDKIGRGAIAEGQITLSGQNDEGTMGGTLRIKQSTSEVKVGTQSGGYFVNSIYHKAFVWWKPIDQLKIFLGQDPDGMFGSDGLVSWNYYQAGTGYLSYHDWGLWRDFFPGNWDSFGLALSVYPVEGLEINLAIPTGTWTNYRLEDVGGLIRLSASYQIGDIGKLFLIYNGPLNLDKYPNVDDTSATGYPDSADKFKPNNKGEFAVSFNITAVEGLQVQPGVNIKLQDKDNGGYDANPTYIGVGAWYSVNEQFTVKLRGGYILNYADSSLPGSADIKKSSAFTIGLLPSYKINDTVTAYLQFEFSQTSYDGEAGKKPWILFPSVKASLGSGSLGIGLNIANDGAKSSAITTVSVPLRFDFSF